MTAPVMTGIGMTPIPIDPTLLGSGANAAALPIETQGVTPEAAALEAEQLRQLQLQNEEKRKKALRTMFGQDFPLVMDHTPVDTDWERWALNRWEKHRSGVSQNVLWAERNRLFRAGQQMLSPYGSNGVWRPAPQPKDMVRIIDNRIRPALAWALEVLSEQRPGWRFQPTNTDADRQRKAEAQQRAVEYQYAAQNMRSVLSEVEYWAQTDGVAFLMTYWDPDKGPWEELEEGRGPVPLGEMCTKVYRIEQVRVSSEATASVRPMYWIIREIIPRQQGVALYGPDIVDAPDQQLLAQQVTMLSSVNQFAYQPLYQDQDTVARYTIFCEKSQWLPQGLTVVIVGKKVVYGPKGLLIGRPPMVRITDGSEDPAFYPTPKMNTLIAPQMRVNQLWSKWYESIRKNSGGRYATKSGAVSAETLIGGEVSMLEVRTTGPINESIMPIQGFTVGTDIKEALDREIKIIEDQTGYNDQARGQFTSDQSGKAILAIREQLERVFAPFVTAVADGMTEWAKQAVGWMRFGYQMPRTVAIIGQDRADLAVSLSATDLDGVVDISVDPETLVPQPKALRQWLLDNAVDRQLISKEQWLKRSPFGDIRDMQSPNKVQFAKAMRVAEQIRLGQPPEPIVWQDDEAIHQDVLDDQLILAGGVDEQVRAAAAARWDQLATQAKQKMAPPPIDPHSPVGQYQEFIAKIQSQAVGAAEKVIAQAIEAADLAGAAATAMTAVPPPPVPGVLPIAASGNGATRRTGQPPDARTAPLFSGTNPSVPTAPAALRDAGSSTAAAGV